MNTTIEKTEKNNQCSSVRYVTPRTNVAENDDAFVLTAELPGVPKDGLDIQIDKDELTIVGHRSSVGENVRPVYTESRHDGYRRVFKISPAVDTSAISAKLEQGILKLTLPKTEEVKPRKIEVAD